MFAQRTKSGKFVRTRSSDTVPCVCAQRTPSLTRVVARRGGSRERGGASALSYYFVVQKRLPKHLPKRPTLGKQQQLHNILNILSRPMRMRRRLQSVPPSDRLDRFQLQSLLWHEHERTHEAAHPAASIGHTSTSSSSAPSMRRCSEPFFFFLISFPPQGVA